MSVLERIRRTAPEPDAGAASAARLGALRSALRSDLIDRLGLDAIAHMLSTEDTSHVRSELAVTCSAILNDQRYDTLLAEERERLAREVIDGVCGLGPIQPLLDDGSVSEVIVNGPDTIFFEREGRLCRSDATFESTEQVLMAIDRILAPLGRRLDRANPIVNARLSNGDRVNAVADPVAINGPAVTIRKFSNRITSLERLVELGSIPSWYARLLTWAVRSRKDIAVAGGTGSGKTTLLNALSCEIDKGERIVTIEDSAELRFDAHPDVVRLEARDASIEGTGEITIRDLVKNALRMRPDRIVVGEVRSGETIDMLQAMNSGHDGSLTTLHAGTPEEAILRLVLMARFGMDLPTDIIEEQVATAIDLIVMSNRFPDGSRCITSMAGVSRAEDGGVSLETLVDFDQAARTWTLVREPPFVAQVVEAGVATEEEVRAWRSQSPRPAA